MSIQKPVKKKIKRGNYKTVNQSNVETLTKKSVQTKAKKTESKEIKIHNERCKVLGLKKKQRDYLEENNIILPERYSREPQPNRYKNTIFDYSFWGKEDKKAPIMIVDRVMGGGKTTAVINFINDQPKDVKFIYVTCYLKEIGRIMSNCPERKFQTPLTQNKKGTKKQGFIDLLKKNENIVCSHALFRNFDKDCIDLASLKNYILIMDEVANVIEELFINRTDLELILGVNEKGEKVNKKALAHIDEETFQLIWDDDKYEPTGKLYEYKKLAELGCLFVSNGNVIIWNFPIDIFQAFHRVFLLTYIFEGQIQKYYYDFFGVEYKYIHISDANGDNNFNARLYSTPQKDDISEYKKLIHIEDKKNFNFIEESQFLNIQEKNNALSKTWYTRNYNEVMILKKKLNNYLTKEMCNVPAEFKMWTTFKDYQKDLSYKGYINQFIELNSRATNQYKDRYVLAYTCNRFMHPIIGNFLLKRGIKVDEDKYALSEMLQWIFRSRIREKKPIWIYIPSPRMKKLLEEWE